MMKALTGMTCRLMVATALFVMTSATLVAAQDFTVQLSNADGKTKTHFVSAKAVRNVSSYPIETDVIYRLDQGEIMTLDHKAKTYTEETLAEARERASKTFEEIEGTSPRQAIRSRMNLASPVVTKIGPDEAILGYATAKYALKSHLVQAEMWVAPALAFPPGFREAAAAAALPAGLTAAADATQHVQGVALKTVAKLMLPMAKGITEIEVATAVDTKPIPASTFEPPSGYRRVQR
jgi:hypothetical protein